MEKIDARTLSQDAQYQIRRQVVKLRLRGTPYAEIADVVGVAIAYACRVYKRYEREGIQGLSKGQRGVTAPARHGGPPRPAVFKMTCNMIYLVKDET